MGFDQASASDTQVQVKLRFPQPPESSKADGDELTEKCHCKGRKRQMKSHVGQLRWSVGDSLGLVPLRKGGLVVLQRMFKRHDLNPQ